MTVESVNGLVVSRKTLMEKGGGGMVDKKWRVVLDRGFGMETG
jgi:hypothetical protein